MPTIVSAFADAAAAQRAADELVKSGFAAESVHLHRQGVAPQNALGIQIDEYATGGMVSNILGLLNGLFDAGKSPGEARNYTDLVRQEQGTGGGGVAVAVSAADEADAQRAEAVLTSAGARKVSRATSSEGG